MGTVAQQIADQWATLGAQIASGQTAEAGHSHEQSDVLDLVTHLSEKVDTIAIGDTVAPLVSGVVPLNYLPSIPMGTTHEVADQSAMLSLNADVGDFAVIAGVATYRLKTLPSSTLGNWVELPVTPGVTSVQGMSGAVMLPIATSTADGLMSSADKTAIATNTSNIATNTSSIATKITDPGSATDGQVLTFNAGAIAWADAATGSASPLWTIVSGTAHTAIAGQRLAITSTNPVTLTLPASGTEGDGIEIENMSAATVSLLGTVNSGLNPLLLPSVLRTYLIWTASGWQCRDVTYPTYGLTGTFTDGSAIASTDELLYAIGTNLGTQSWVNPHTAGRVEIVRSSIGSNGGTNEQVCDRSNSINLTTSTAGSWYCCDFGADGTGRQVLPSKFRFQHGHSNGDYRCLSLIVEGSNNALSNSVADLNTATWSTIATSSSLGLAAVGYSWSTEIPLAGSTWYRWLRIRQTATNSAGNSYLMIGEIAFGGKIRFT